MKDIKNIVEIENASDAQPCKCGCSTIKFYRKATKDGLLWGMFCEECDRSIDAIYETQESALDLWNRRVQPTFKEVRMLSGMNQTQFAEYFHIPRKTVQNWDSGTRECPSYLLELMQYKLDNEASKAENLSEQNL